MGKNKKTGPTPKAYSASGPVFPPDANMSDDEEQGLTYDPTGPPVSNDKPTTMNQLTEVDFNRLEATMKLALATQHAALEELLDERLRVFKEEDDLNRINDMAIRQLERGCDRNDILGFVQRQMIDTSSSSSNGTSTTTPTPTLTTSSAILATPTSSTTTVAAGQVTVFCKAEKMKWPQCPTNLQDFSLVQGWRA
jgi:hypothetical protein